MFPSFARATMSCMEIKISFEQTDPPTGRVVGGGGELVPFSGWLGLLKALSELVARGEAHAEPLPPLAARAR